MEIVELNVQDRKQTSRFQALIVSRSNWININRLGKSEVHIRSSEMFTQSWSFDC
jgi:hypothetical protein